MADANIVLEIATLGVDKIQNLSNALQQLHRTLDGVKNPMRNLDARSRALSAAVGSSGSSLNNYAKSVSQLARNQAVLSNELGRVSKDLKNIGRDYQFAAGTSRAFKKQAVSDLQQYQQALKGIKARALVSDLKAVAQEQKRLGKDAQFVGRSLIIGLTTPIMGFARIGLQSLVAIDKEFVRLNKVLEGVAPNLDAASKKIGVDLASATQKQKTQLNEMVGSYEFLNKALTATSIKYGIAKSLTVSLAGDYAELGIQATKSIASITDLTAATEKLGNMDIGAAQDLIQSLYFQAVRAMQMSGEARNMTAEQRETAAIGAAKAQLAMFNAVENTTALTLRDLGDAFPEVAAAASSFGLSMTEAAAMLAPMKAAGFDIGASANSIKVSLQRIVAPTKQNADMFKALSEQYKVNFNLIKGTGIDAIQTLIDAYNELRDSAAGQEGVAEFFAKVFGVRQGPRMETAISQMADFDSILKDASVTTDRAEKQLQIFANQAISSVNKAKNANIPLINSYKDIAVVARIATAAIDPKKGYAVIEGYGKVTQQQIDAAIEARNQLSDAIFQKSQKDQVDLIGQVATESGRAMFIELAGVKNAQAVADRELEASLSSLDTKISIVKNNFKMFAADLLTGIKPALEKIAQVTTDLYQKWTQLSPQTKALISKVVLGFAALTASIGPLVFIFGQFRLAIGTIGKVLLGFLPALKTMSIDSIAAGSGMLRLSKPLTVVGDTVVNTNGKFATFLATLAGGDGPLKNFANKLGIMTGALQKQNTAPVQLLRRINMTAGQAGTVGQIAGAAPGTVATMGGLSNTQRGRILGRLGVARPPAQLPTVQPITAQTLIAQQRAIRLQQVNAVRRATGATSGQVINAAGRADIIRMSQAGGFSPRDLFAAEQRLATGARTFATPQVYAAQRVLQGRQGAQLRSAMQSAGGRAGFFRFQPAAVQSATQQILNQNLFNPASIANQATANAMAAQQTQQATRNAAQQQQRTARNALKAESRKMRTFARKGIDYDMVTGQASFKGRDISQQRATDIFRGGAAGTKARTAEFAQRRLEPIKAGVGKIKALPSNVADGFTKSVNGAKNSLRALHSQHAAVGAGSPRMLARMSTAMRGFVNSTNFGTKAIKLMKIAMMSSGILAVMLAIGVAVVIVKNNMNKFAEAGKTGMKIVGGALKTIKDAALEIVRPIMDLFSHFGKGGQGAEGAAEGIGNAFNKLAGIFKWLANMFKMVVEKFIQPYLYFIINIVAAVVSLFQGKWKQAFKYLMAAVAFAVEVFINTFALGFKIIVSLIGGFIKAAISLLGLLGKGVIEYVVSPITLLLKGLSSLPVVGDKFKGINDKFRSIVNGAKGIVDSATSVINGAVDSATKGTNNFIDKQAGNLKKKIQGLKKGGIDKSTGKVEITTKVTPEVDKSAQEKITNAVGTGIENGADQGAKALRKKLRGELIKELQQLIADKIKDKMDAVVESITKALQDQKEASLKLYDDQLQKIDDLQKAEERLTKVKEYENRRREIEEKRALNVLNFARQKALAIYEGRIDDARQIGLEQVQSEKESKKELTDLNDDRAKQVADEQRQDLIQSINEAKKKAGEYFDEMITKFKEGAKKITEFPPTTAEEFNTMLNQLINGGGGFIGAKQIATDMGTYLSDSFTGPLGNLGVDATSPLTTSLTTLGEVLTNNNPFGPEGVWQTTINESIDYLTRKYQGLTNTLNTVVDESSESFKKLFDTYVNYKKLVDETSGETSGGTTGGSTTTNKGTPATGGGGGANTGATKISNVTSFAKQLYETKFSRLFEKAPTKAVLDAEKAIVNLMVPILNYHKSNPSPGGSGALSWFIKNNKDWSSGNKYIAYQTVIPGLDLSKYSFQYGGLVPKFNSTAVPTVLHGGEYVVNSQAVRNIGLATLQQMNAMRFATPSGPKSPSVGSTYHEQNININVDTFIGERSWFESMMKDYNITIAPQNQKNAGLENRKISTYNGINRGM